MLGAGPAALGLIEGLADTVSNLLKLWSGRRSDLFGQRRKRYVVFGYTLSNLVRPLIALSASWLMVLALRVIDRMGKGVRTAPRDAMVADVIEPGTAGRAYGFTRAMDHAGAVLGALAAAAVLHLGMAELDLVILLSAIPGLAAVAVFALGVTEPPRAYARANDGLLRWSTVGPDARRYLALLTYFALGRIPETFILLRGYQLGMNVVTLLLMWAAIHVVKSSVSESAGRLADRIGRRPVILAGWASYSLAMGGLAFIDQAPAFIAGSLVLAVYFGLSEGAERALVRDLARPEEHGTAFGWYHMLTGLAAVPAGVLLGGLWQEQGVRLAFLVSAAVAASASLAFWRTIRPRAA